MEVKDIISSGLLELYVTGIASPEEKRQVEQWSNQYPEVKQEIEELQEAMENYVMAEAIQPDVIVKEKIFARIGSVPINTAMPSSTPVVNIKNNEGIVYRIPSYIKWAVAASIILLIGSIALTYNFYNKYQTASSELQKQQQVAEAMHKDMDVMTDKNAMPVVLNGTEHAPDALAKIFWMKNTGDVYVDPTNLPETPSGMQYQLWAIIDGKPVDGGMISTNKGVYHIQKMKSFGKAEAFAITLEKEGGSPTPTMDRMYVMAKMKI